MSHNFHSNTLPHDSERAYSLDGFSDPNVTNGKRVERVSALLLEYRNPNGLESETAECVTDLVVDLMHLLHSKSVDPLVIMERAKGHFLEEA